MPKLDGTNSSHRSKSMPRALCVATFLFSILVLHSDRAFAQDAATRQNAGPQFCADGPNSDEFGRKEGYPSCRGLEYIDETPREGNEQMDRQDQDVAHERQNVTSAQHNTEPGRDSCWKLRIRHPQDSEAKTSASASGGPPSLFCEVSRTRPVPGMIELCSQRILLRRGRRGDLLDQSCTAISCVG